MTRYPDWPARLTAAIADQRRRPFVWGERDCCLLAADLVHAMTGADCAQSLRGQYSTEAEARQIVEDNGGLQELASKMIGCQPADGYPVRGDVVLCKPLVGGDMPQLGVWLGGRAIVAGKAGLFQRGPRHIACRWAI